MEGRVLRRLGVALLAAALLATQASFARAASGPVETVHLLVHFASVASLSERANAARAIGGAIEGEIPALGVTRVAVAVERGTDPDAPLRAISSFPNVGHVERDARVHLDWLPNDPYWSTDPYAGLGQWGNKMILADRARDLVGSLMPVVVAVIDTGVDADHPDLAGVVLPGATILRSQTPGCAADGSGGDDNSHGTHVAGIIAANAGNGIGIAGIAPNARILPIKALDCSGSGSLADIAQAITYAVDHGARVINISLGASSDSATLEAAVQYATSHDVLIVAAVGNCGASNASRCLYTANRVEYPGASPGVLGVGATSMDDSIAPFSTQGTQVGVSAPGVRIVSTTPPYATYQSQRGLPRGYASLSGTSQATPFVTASAALLLGLAPTLTAQQVASRLKTTASDLGVPGTDIVYGAGRVDLLRAVTASIPSFSAKYDTSFVPRSATSDVAFTAKVAVTNTSQATWSATGAAAVELSYHWLDAEGNAVVWEGVRTALPTDVRPGATIAIDLRVLAPSSRGSYVLRIDLFRGGVGWFSSRGVPPAEVEVAVVPAHDAAYLPLTLNVWLSTAAPSPLVVTLRNTGTLPWAAGGANPMRLSYHWFRGGVMTVWDGARASFSADVMPGETVIVELPVVPPLDLAANTMRLDLVEEGVRWFSDEGVAPRDVSYLVTTGYRAEYTPSLSAAVVTGAPPPLTVTLRNTGMRPWAAGGAHPVELSYHWLRDGAVAVWDGARAALEHDVQPGETVTVLLPVVAPQSSGAYALRLDLVEEGRYWFSDDGIATRDLAYLFIARD